MCNNEKLKYICVVIGNTDRCNILLNYTSNYLTTQQLKQVV